MKAPRRLLLCAGFFGCLAVVAGFVAWLFWSPEAGVTPENFARLHKGMTEAEVVAILGEPARTGPHAGHLLWLSPTHAAAIAFGEDGKVEDGAIWKADDGDCYEGLRQPAESLLVRLRRWLRL